MQRTVIFGAASGTVDEGGYQASAPSLRENLGHRRQWKIGLRYEILPSHNVAWYVILPYFEGFIPSGRGVVANFDFQREQLVLGPKG